MHFLLNHPELRQDVTETLKLRQHDAEESVRYFKLSSYTKGETESNAFNLFQRYEVVTAIVATAKRDFSIVSDRYSNLSNFNI